MSDENHQKSFRTFAVLLALCCASHVAVHLARAELTAGYLLGVAVFLSSMWVIRRPIVRTFLTLAILQMASVVVEAPHNPDHWLLIFFVNVVACGAALKLWWADRTVTPERLMAAIVPAGRLIFLVCYGFAAISKWNTDFLFSDKSVARELFSHQAGAMPILSWLVWPPGVPWVALMCETLVPLLLLFGRTRSLGIVVGVAFHAALMISPAVAVFDFTLVVYTMLYLFTPSGFDDNVRAWWKRRSSTQAAGNEFAGLLCRWLPVAASVMLIAVSLRSSMGDLSARLTWLRWMVAMAIVCCLGGLCLVGLLTGERRSASIQWLPRWGLPYAVLGLAIFNGLCPYVGLKTQGSFTMFSNLQTEAGEWNHLFMPARLRIVDDYQDRLVKIVATDDPVLHGHYVERGLLATEFEVRRRVTSHPGISLTVERQEQEVVIARADSDPILGRPLDTLSRKLLIFRPVSPDAEPFVSN